VISKGPRNKCGFALTGLPIRRMALAARTQLVDYVLVAKAVNTSHLANVTGAMNRRDSRDEGLLALAEDYRILESTRCRCSSGKSVGEALCGDCLEQLPDPHRNALRTARPAITFGDIYRAASVLLDKRSKRRFSR
jgi:hypothetical protein